MPDAATVLLAEDNRDLRRFVTGLLAPHYTVIEAADGTARSTWPAGTT